MKASLDDVQSVADKASISLKFDRDASDPVVFADAHRIAQVVSNLVSNAIKFSHRGSQVLVRVETNGNLAKVSVEDFGRGIPEAFRPMMFRRFSREASVQADGTEGFGLGLSICRQLVLEMNGDIDFESTPGCGTTFFFTLPLVVPVGEVGVVQAAECVLT